jgi:Tol biopolymer transport system component
MKRCPECRRDYYDDSLLYCLDDGTALLEGPATGDSPTAILSGEDSDPVTRPLIPHADKTEIHRSMSSAEYLVTSAKKNKTIAIVALLILAALVGGVGFAFYRYRSPSENTARAIRLERVTTDGKTNAAAISPDGKNAVYNIDAGGAQSLWNRQTATGSTVQIVPPAEGVEYRSIRFTPDGNFVTFIKRDTSNTSTTFFNLYQMSAFGGPQKKLAEDVDGGVTYSPDGKQLAFLRGNHPELGDSSIIIANADGTGERIVAKRTRPETFPWWPVGTAAFSPDGKSIATVIGGNASGGVPMQVAEIDIETGAVKPVSADGWYEIFQVAWLPDKSGLLVIGAEKASDFYSQQIFLLSYPEGVKRRITTDFNMYLGISLTADGKTIAAIQDNRTSNIWMVPGADAARAEQIRSGGTNHEGTDGLALAPDGRVVFYSKASGGDDIWIMNGDGSDVKQLTIDAGANYDLKVTPDGRYIVFTSERAGQPNIWRMDLDGRNAKQLTFGTSEYGAALSPDSKWVYYDSTSSGSAAIWKVSIDGGEPVQVVKRASENPEISPDGKLIACQFRENVGASWRFGMFSSEGGEPLKVYDIPQIEGADFRWAPDGKSLTYHVVKKGVSNVWSLPIDGGPPKQLTNFKNDLMFNFKWAPNGKDMIMARGSRITDVVLIHDFR